MRPSLGDVLATLKLEGLATDAADAPAREALRASLADDLPWFLRLAIGAGAWVATGFLFGFFMVVAGFDSPAARMVVGIALIAGAVRLRPRAPNEFLRHASVAAGLAGQGLLLAGVHEQLDAPRATAAVAAAAGMALLVLIPDGVHRFLTTLAVAAAAFVLLVDHQAPWRFEAVTVMLMAATAVVWRARPARWASHDEVLRPIGYALVVGLLAALLVGTSTQLGRLSFDAGPWVVLGRISTAGGAVALLLLARAILAEHRGAGRPGGDAGRRSSAAVATYAGIAILAVTTMSTPGIIAGAGVLTLAFDRRDRVLMGMGIVFLLLFGLLYYYNMNLTLLEKSFILAGSGALLLGIRQRLVRA